MTRFQFPTLFGLLLGITFLANCQSPAGNKPKPGASLEAQATFFIKTIVAYDFNSSADYYLPEYLESLGGREAAIQGFKKDIKGYQDDGIKLSGGRVDNQTPISKCNGTWQCVFRQEVFMTMAAPGSEPFPLHTNLVAVSRDEGQTWKFLMGGADDLPTLRQKFPILCEDLVLQKY